MARKVNENTHIQTMNFILLLTKQIKCETNNTHSLCGNPKKNSSFKNQLNFRNKLK